MATKNFSVSFDELDIENTKAAAAAEGLSLSAYIARATRHENLRVNGRRYREIRNNPDPQDRADQAIFAAHSGTALWGDTTRAAG
jgi:hypothetical protein